METLVGTTAPEFTLNAVVGGGEFAEVTSESLEGKWTVLLFYPPDFTFVCPASWTKDAKSMKPTDDGLEDYFKG